MKLTILGSGTSVPHATSAASPHFFLVSNGRLRLKAAPNHCESSAQTVSDTGFSEDLITFAKHADLLLMECSFRRNKPVQKHLELVDAMNLARECVPKKLVLTHLYPEWDEIDLVAEARTLWSGETIEAQDGLRVEI